MLLCCMAATLMLACSNDKSGGHDGDEGVETEVNGTQLDGNTTLYGLVTDTSGNPVPGVVVSDGTSTPRSSIRTSPTATISC